MDIKQTAKAARMRRDLRDGNGPVMFAGLTQREIADAVGATQSSVSKWLAGTFQPGMDFALRLAELLDEINLISGESQASRSR